jgi:hypothetical protein
VTRYKHQIRYVPRLGWRVWDGTRWKEDYEGCRIKSLAEVIVQQYAKDAWKYIKEGDRDSFNAQTRAAVRAASAAGINGIVSCAAIQGDIIADSGDFDLDRDVLHGW